MKIKFKIAIQILAMIFIVNSLNAQNKDVMEETKIRNLVEECYLNGALNEMNTEKMYEGYHPDFAIFYSEGKTLKKLPLKEWVEMVENYKKSNDTKGLRNFEYEFTQIDVTETAGFVKLKLMRNDELIFTDLLTLLKFEDEWKIVTKIYHSHTKNPWNL